MEKRFQDCFAIFDGALLSVGNSLIKREWTVEPGAFQTRSISGSATHIQQDPTAGFPFDFRYEGLSARKIANIWKPSPLLLIKVEAFARRAPRLGPPRLTVRLTFEDPKQGLTILWQARILPGVEAISIQCEIRSETGPMGDYNRSDYANVLDSIPLSPDVTQIESVLFRARSDRTNDLSEDTLSTPEEFQENGALGNVLFAINAAGAGFFVLHDGPCKQDRRSENNLDFYVEDDTLRCAHWGIRPEDVSHKRFLRSYSVTLGLFTGGRAGARLALKRFMKKRYPYLGENRPVLIANPWGDRHWYEHAHAAFVLKELEACADIGLTDYQLDDGWQGGGNLNDLVANLVVTDEYWKPHPKNFPNGFAPLKKEGKRLGVKLALWYSADSNRNYRRHQDDVRRLIRLYEAGGFDRIKIDMIRTRTKDAEDSLFRIFQKVRSHRPDKIVFDLDVTGSAQRPGYFILQDYGDIFVENRYTMFVNYFPWLTAKNFWRLAQYMPLQRLEMEFLNPRLNPQKYPDDNPLSPKYYSIGYLFMLTFFAIPLCWCEPSAISKADRRTLRPLTALRRQLHQRIRDGLVIPIGDEPDGQTWFGFLAVDENTGRGLMTLFRDRLTPETGVIEIPRGLIDEGKLKRLAGSVEVSIVQGEFQAKAVQPGSFGLFEF